MTGFGHGTRARDLAHEFERYVRPLCVVQPAPLDYPNIMPCVKDIERAHIGVGEELLQCIALSIVSFNH